MSVRRTDDDSWDIATSVGATAVMVAVARAIETASADPLIRDELAAPLVSTPELAEVRANVEANWVRTAADEAKYLDMVRYQAVRTHFFDEFFEDESAVFQVVILAAGLDSRAYRLNWPDGTVVYELDLPKVLEYKAVTLAAHGAQPVITRREVAADLRHDWPAALCDAGFDPTRPTSWLAEGLLPFLTGPAQDAMFAALDAVSAAGSRIAVEAFPLGNAVKASVDRHRAQLAELNDGDGAEPTFDLGDLWYDDEGRSNVVDWFAAHGWTTRVVDSRDESMRLGRPVSPNPDDDTPFYANFVVAAKA